MSAKEILPILWLPAHRVTAHLGFAAILSVPFAMAMAPAQISFLKSFHDLFARPPNEIQTFQPFKNIKFAHP